MHASYLSVRYLQQVAFNSLKGALSNPSVLAFPSWSDPSTLHSNASMVGAGAILTLSIQSKEFIIAVASHRRLKTDSNRGLTERERITAPYAASDSRKYLARRRFTLVPDCFALTWLFCSRDLCPKLHRWPLKLLDQVIVLRWRSGP